MKKCLLRRLSLLLALLLCLLTVAPAAAEPGACALSARVTAEDGVLTYMLYCDSGTAVDAAEIRLSFDPARLSPLPSPAGGALAREGAFHVYRDGGSLTFACAFAAADMPAGTLLLSLTFSVLVPEAAGEPGITVSDSYLSCADGAGRAFCVFCAMPDGEIRYLTGTAEAQAAALADTLAAGGPEDLTGNGTADENDVLAALMHITGALPDVSVLPELLAKSLLGEKYLDRFSYTGTVNEPGRYQSANVAYTLSVHKEPRLTYYVAELFVRDIRHLRTALALGKYNNAQPVMKTAEANHAIVAINGDCYFGRERGVVFQNGVLYRDRLDRKREIAVLMIPACWRSCPSNRSTSKR